MIDRYTVQGSEVEFEPGSNETVLRNLRGIKSTKEMDDVEAMEQVFSEVVMRTLGST